MVPIVLGIKHYRINDLPFRYFSKPQQKCLCVCLLLQGMYIFMHAIVLIFSKFFCVQFLYTQKHLSFSLKTIISILFVLADLCLVYNCYTMKIIVLKIFSNHDFKILNFGMLQSSLFWKKSLFYSKNKHITSILK